MTTTPNPQVNSVPAARLSVPAHPASGSSERTARYRRLIHDLRPGEKVLLLQRRHPLVLLGKLSWPVVLLIVWLASLAFVLPFLSSLSRDPLLSPGGGPPAWLPMVSWVAWIGIAVGIVLWAAYIIFDWADHWIALTTRRLILMDKTLFFRETRREAPLAKVQNVIAEYPNALGTSLDFGHIKVDTAGIGVLAFHNVPHPKVLREAIFAQQAALRANQPPPEDRRRASIEKIVLGADPLSHERPTPPTGNLPPGSRRGMQPAAPSSVPDNGTFGSLFPFSAQRSGKIVVWHRHWYFLARSVGKPLLIFTASLAGWIASILLGEPGMVGPIESIMGWVTVALTPICGLWALWNFEDWRNDVYKLDHERVYHVESLPLGMREQSKETLITRITDVTYLVPSPVANLLNFGDVVIKTPGEATEFVFKHIPSPREVQQEIMARVDEYRLKEHAGVDREIEAWIKTYHEANRKT